MSHIKLDYLDQSIKLVVTIENIKEKMNECSRLLLGVSELDLSESTTIKEITVKDGLIIYRMKVKDDDFNMYYEGELSAHKLSMILMDTL